MGNLRNRLMHLMAIPAILLLCAGWLQPVFPHSCLLHEPCGVRPCCAGKQAPDLQVPDLQTRASGQAGCHDRTAPALDSHAQTANTQPAHAQKNTGCSKLQCFESQQPVITALFEDTPVFDSSPLRLVPGAGLSAPLLHCRLFRPPITAIL